MTGFVSPRFGGELPQNGFGFEADAETPAQHVANHGKAASYCCYQGGGMKEKSLAFANRLHPSPNTLWWLVLQPTIPTGELPPVEHQLDVPTIG